MTNGYKIKLGSGSHYRIAIFYYYLCINPWPRLLDLGRITGGSLSCINQLVTAAICADGALLWSSGSLRKWLMASGPLQDQQRPTQPSVPAPAAVSPATPGVAGWGGSGSGVAQPEGLTALANGAHGSSISPGTHGAAA